MNLASFVIDTKKQSSTDDYLITHEIISGGPTSFAKNPTAIKLGRALFVPIILISHLYDRNTKIQK